MRNGIEADVIVAATLHCVHGVSGLRAGTLPGVSSQNVFLGLPVTLMQEETAWLVQQGVFSPKYPAIPLRRASTPSRYLNQ